MKKLLLLFILLTVSGFSTQPLDERKAQALLPQASGDVWSKLSKTHVDFNQKTGRFTANVTPEIKAMSGKIITVNGFMLPLDPTEKQSHFLLSKRTPTCPYCMPGGPEEIFDIYMKEPLTYDEGVLYITGKFQLMNDSKKGLFFRLTEAKSNGSSWHPLKKSQKIPMA